MRAGQAEQASAIAEIPNDTDDGKSSRWRRLRCRPGGLARSGPRVGVETERFAHRLPAGPEQMRGPLRHHRDVSVQIAFHRQERPSLDYRDSEHFKVLRRNELIFDGAAPLAYGGVARCQGFDPRDLEAARHIWRGRRHHGDRRTACHLLNQCRA